MIVIGKLHLWWDWWCLHWVVFGRGLTDGRGVIHMDEWEFCIGPLHVWWFSEVTDESSDR